MQIGNEGSGEGKIPVDGFVKSKRILCKSTLIHFVKLICIIYCLCLYWLVANNFQLSIRWFSWCGEIFYAIAKQAQDYKGYAAKNASQNQARLQFYVQSVASFCSRSISSLCSSSAIYSSAYSRPNWAIRSSIKLNHCSVMLLIKL